MWLFLLGQLSDIDKYNNNVGCTGTPFREVQTERLLACHLTEG
jgi:hypothetical protein